MNVLHGSSLNHSSIEHLDRFQRFPTEDMKSIYTDFDVRQEERVSQSVCRGFKATIRRLVVIVLQYRQRHSISYLEAYSLRCWWLARSEEALARSEDCWLGCSFEFPCTGPSSDKLFVRKQPLQPLGVRPR